MPFRVPVGLVRIESVRLRGHGALILTGPSSCGKGEVASALCRVLSIDKQAHLSMGEILRTTIFRAKSDVAFAKTVENQYRISVKSNVYECEDTTDELTRKVRSHAEGLRKYFNRADVETFVSQLEWLEYCTMSGLLVPNRWTQDLIAAHIEHTPSLRTSPFILDGYPRTVAAAKHLIELLRRLDIPISKVLHLSISKQEMISRALLRGRPDDDGQALLSRYNFYVESVQPSVDFLKLALGSERVALIDAHQPVYEEGSGEKRLKLDASISNVVTSALLSLGVPSVVIRDLLDRD